MNYEEFVQEVMKELPSEYESVTGKEVNIERVKVEKNNGVVLDGIVTKLVNNPISPTIYLEAFYEDYESGSTMTGIVAQLAGTIEEAFEQSPSFEMPTKEFLLKSVIPEVIGIEINRNFVKDLPHRVVEDMTIIYRCQLNDNATYVLHNDHLDGLSEEELFQSAMENIASKFEMKEMTQMLAEMLAVQNGMSFDEAKTMLDEDMDKRMYVVSNKTKVYGAAELFVPGILDEIRDVLKEDFYVLPSSIHECIVLPMSDADPEELKNMVCDINASIVSQEERLTDNVYSYDGLTHEFMCASERKVRDRNNIVADIKKNEYLPTNSLVSNMEELGRKTKNSHITLELVKELTQSTMNADIENTVNSIVSECKKQRMAIQEPER